MNTQDLLQSRVFKQFRQYLRQNDKTADEIIELENVKTGRRNNKMDNNRLNAKDLINVGIYTAICAVIC